MEVPYLLQANAEVEPELIPTHQKSDEEIGVSGYPCAACRFFARAALRVFSSEAHVDRHFAAWNAHQKSAACSMRIVDKSKSHVGNGKPVGPFAFTLTKSPKDPLTVGDMLIAVRKVLGQKTKPVVKYAWYYEDKGRDDNGDPIHPHIHGMYETEDGGRIPARQFERAWKIWDETKPMGSGFVGGYHRPVKNDEAYADYISKDGGLGESKGL